MIRADLHIIRAGYKRRIDAALARNRPDRFGQRPGVKGKLWSLGSWLHAHGAIDDLTPAEQELGMTHNAYAAFATDPETMAEGLEAAMQILGEHYLQKKAA